MISLEANKVTWNHPLELSLEVNLWIISIRFLNLGEHSKLTLAYTLIASYISFWHRNEHIVLAFFIYHIHALHFELVITSLCIFIQHAFLLYKLHTFYFHVHSCMILAFSSAKQKKEKQKQKKKNKRKSRHILSCMCLVPWWWL